MDSDELVESRGKSSQFEELRLVFSSLLVPTDIPTRGTSSVFPLSSHHHMSESPQSKTMELLFSHSLIHVTANESSIKMIAQLSSPSLECLSISIDALDEAKLRAARRDFYPAFSSFSLATMSRRVISN